MRSYEIALIITAGGSVLAGSLRLDAQVPRRGARTPAPTEQPTQQPVPQPVPQLVTEPIGVAGQPLAPLSPKDMMATAGFTVPTECTARSPQTPDTRPRGAPAVGLTADVTSNGILLRWQGASDALRHVAVRIDPTASGGGGGGMGWLLNCLPELAAQVPQPEPILRAGPVERRVLSDPTSPTLAAVPVEAPAAAAAPMQSYQHEDRYVCRGKTYQYYVVSYYTDRAPARSETVQATTPPGPPPPSMGTLTASGHAEAAELMWRSVPGAYEYRVYRDRVKVATITPREAAIGVRFDTTFSDQAVPPGTRTYEVHALMGCDFAPTLGGEPLAVATTTVKVLPKPVWGFADLHVHQFANLAFGGKMFWGAAYGPPEQALAWCTEAHGPGGVGDNLGTVMALISNSGDVGHRVGGHPQYDGWPRWNTFTHQQVYADWLKRALDGGLKLMVMYAVNNEALCSVVSQAKGRTCNDMEAVDLQIDAAKAMESYIDAQSGGAGRGWYRIVYSPQQAREAIAKGQLAVVLGTEIPTLFNCRATGGCTPEFVRTELARYYAKGIRQILPIHNADNGFGGAAVYTDFFNMSNKKIAGDYFSVRDCSGSGVGFTFKIGAAAAHASALWSALPFGPYSPPDYSGSGHCNQRGLTSLGDFFIRALMHQKMLIDVDHMSWLALDAVFAIARENKQNYPLVNSHTGFLDVSRGEKRSEGQKTQTQIQAMRQLGGLIAPILFQGSRAETQYKGSKIPHDCGNSSQSWAQAYLYLVQQLGGAPVALGSDFNGLAGQPSPRFGAEACQRGDKGAQAELGGRVMYPFAVHGAPTRKLDKSVVGDMKFDINVHGLAHIGMLPDFIQDLKVQGLTDQDLEPLFRSAEAYIRMWEKIEETNVLPPISD